LLLRLGKDHQLTGQLYLRCFEEALHDSQRKQKNGSARLVSADERVKSWRKISRTRRIVARRVEEIVALRFADLNSQRADATCQHRREIKVAASAMTFFFLARRGLRSKSSAGSK
jgi:hypothetical protein